MNIITDLLNNPSGEEIIVTFFKLFAVVFSLMYLIYSLVVYRQTKIMSQAIQVNDQGGLKRQNLIAFGSRLQLLIGIVLIVFAFVIFIS